MHIIEQSTQTINKRSYQLIKFMRARNNVERVGIHARKRISSKIARPAW